MSLYKGNTHQYPVGFRLYGGLANTVWPANFDGELKNVILTGVPVATLDDYGRVSSKKFDTGRKGYFDLDVCYMKHRFKKNDIESNLVESMEMVASTKRKGRAIDIYKKTIMFDHCYFQNLIALPDDYHQRNKRLVDSARQVLGDLLPQ